MPNESVNLYISVQSGSSERTLTSLADKTRALDKETQLLAQTTEALTKANKPLLTEQTRLQAELDASKKTVKELQKAYDEYGDELMKLDLDQAIENHAKLKGELSEVNAQINANQKTYKEYLEDIRKSSLDAGGSSSVIGGKNTGLSDIAKGMFAGQIGQMFSSSLGGLGESWLTSAIGTPQASLISDALSSAITGGAAGSMFGLPGILLGGGLGLISGLISGGNKIFEAQDDAFKEYYSGLYNTVSAVPGEMVAAGSATAGSREQTHMAFVRRFGGDEEADAYLAQVEEMAARTNYDYDEIVGYAKLLLNSYAPEDVFDVLQSLSDATAGLDLSGSDVNMMISGLSRMRTTGKATQEYLNYFRERGVDVDQALADSLGVEKSAVAGMVTKGDIGGEAAAEAILKYINEQYGGLSDDLASTYEAMVDNLGDIKTSLEAMGGEAYNQLRKEGVQAEMDALGGALGEALGQINAVMGENQARMENLQEQYMREALEAVLLGQEGSLFDEEQQAELQGLSEKYAEWARQYAEGNEEAGLHMESLYEQARVLGQAYYEDSDEVATLNQVEVEEIDAIRTLTASLDNATQALLNRSQALSKGYGAAHLDAWIDERGIVRGAEDADEWTPEGDGASAWIDERGNIRWDTPASHAYGLDRVPYDGYPALLHEGERVLTAGEARAQDADRGAATFTITVTGNSFVGTGEEMADQIAELIARRLEQARTAMGR